MPQPLKNFLLLVLLSTCGHAIGQDRPPPTYGADTRSAAMKVGISDVNLLDQLVAFIPGIGSPSREDLLRQNIKSYMMPVRSCPGANMEWAYALAGCLEYYVNLNNNFKDNLSPDYLTLSIAGSGKRPNLLDGLKLLQETGTVSAAIVPYGSTFIPNSVYSVPRYNIANFGYLFQPETRPRNRVFETRKALSRGNPVLVELATDAAFTQLRGSDYTLSGAATEVHYLTVVGYDGNNETFELRSSLGRGWGDGGYVRLSYDDFGRLARAGYVLIPR